MAKDSVDRRQLLTQMLSLLPASALLSCSRSGASSRPGPGPGPQLPQAPSAPAADHDMSAYNIPSGPPQQIVMLAYQGMTALDLVGPQFFFATLGNVEVHLIAKTAGPIVTDTGLEIVATKTFEQCPSKIDALFVPGGTTGTVAVMKDRAQLDFVASCAAHATWVTSVCTGALILGAAGALKGYRATTHWAARDLLQDCGATYGDERVVRDRNRVTGAGVSAGLDLGITLAQLMRGPAMAEGLTLAAEYAPAPPVVINAKTPDSSPTAGMLRMMYAPFVAEAKLALTL